MFQKACSTVRNAVYGILASTSEGSLDHCTTGTGFMIAPGVIATVAHLVRVGMDPEAEVHEQFEVIRAPDVGESMEDAFLIAEYPERDVALLRVPDPRSGSSLAFVDGIVPHGASCGSLGYPLAYVEALESGRNFVLVERFQGANISSYHTENTPDGDFDWYETDALMYSGSSGCPGFLVDGRVFGMQVRSLTRIEDVSPNDGTPKQETRIAISQWAPAHDIISIARNHGVRL